MNRYKEKRKQESIRRPATDRDSADKGNVKFPDTEVEKKDGNNERMPN